MEHWYLLYVLMTFSIGMATLGTIALAVRKTQERSLTYYLFLHIVSTLAVFSQMFFLYLQTSLSGVSPETIGFMEYVEDFAIEYALMIALLLFLHEFFAVSHAKTRNLMMCGLAALANVVAHVLFFGIQNRSLARHVNNTTLLAVLMYAVAVGLYSARRLENPSRKTLATRVILYAGICSPGILDELWFHAIFPMPVFPVLYSGISIIVTVHLFTQVFNAASVPDTSSESTPDHLLNVSPSTSSHEALFHHYDISPRERDVVNLVLEGRSNQEIGDRLYISLSTVKTHLRKIYQKVDVKSRYELIVRFKNAAEGTE